VLALAEDTSQPLLERAKFLAIFASNLDEFFMVRVAGLKRRDETGLTVRSADGMTPREQLARIAERSQALAERHALAFQDSVRPALSEHGICILHWDDLTEAQRAKLSGYFSDQVFPVLTPLAVDPAHPFPYISGLSLNLAVTVRDPQAHTERFARVKVPNNVPRLVPVEPADPAAPNIDVTFLPIEDLIAAHLGELFTAWRSPSTTPSGSPATPTWTSRRTATRTCYRPWSGNWRGAGSAAGAARGHRLDERARAGAAAARAGRGPHDVMVVPGMLDLTMLWRVYGWTTRS